MDFINHIKDYAKDLRGNWKKFTCFIWDRELDLPDPDNWAIVYFTGCGSGLISQSNAYIVSERLHPFLNSGDIYEEYHYHWASGSIEGYAVRVNKVGSSEYTSAFIKVCELLMCIQENVLLDETHYYRLKKQTAINNIQNELELMELEITNEELATKVYDWLAIHEPELIDQDAVYIVSDDILLALQGLPCLPRGLYD
jgi:hypothetical protein